MNKILKKIDFMQKSFLFNINKSPEKNIYFKSSFGGILSILLMISILSSIIYFLLDFLKYDKPLVNMNEENILNPTYKNISNIPFIYRITDDYGKLIENEEKVIKYGYIWFDTEFNEKGNLIQIYHFLSSSKCNLEDHFPSEIREIIKNNIPDLSSYHCTDFHKYNETDLDVVGLYGGNLKYTFGGVTFKQCYDAMNKSACMSGNEINKSLSNVYLDYKTINTFVNSFNINPLTTEVISNRISLNNQMYTRVWLGIQLGYYMTDIGIIFESYDEREMTKIQLYDIEKKTIDLDLIVKGEYPFASVTFQNHPTIIKYKRLYKKGQELIANIGGIVKGILLISNIIGIIFNSFDSIISLIKIIPSY